MARMLVGNFVTSGGVHIDFSTSKQDVVMSKIRACLLTMKGEIPSQPEVGSNVRKMVFALNSPDQKALLSLTVQEDLAFNVPEIGTLNVTIDDDENNRNKANISIYFLYQGETGKVTQGVGG